MNVINSETVKLKAKRTFLKKGTCSRTFFYILNHDFGFPVDEEERAVDPLAGGILQQGYQCGMLWGASMAVGAESFRRNGSDGQAIGITIKATQLIMESFSNRTKSIECEEISKCDFKNKISFAKYMLSGKFLYCYKLAGKWAPEAIKAANEGLSLDSTDISKEPLSCASEVVKKMGGSEKEIHMVAGFAGGLGLSGSGCGTLSAAIWKTIFELVKKDKWKYSLSDPVIEEILQKFYEATNYEMECHKICGQRFETVDDHTVFIKKGGCEKLINVLANGNSLQ